MRSSGTIADLFGGNSPPTSEPRPDSTSHHRRMRPQISLVHEFGSKWRQSCLPVSPKNRREVSSGETRVRAREVGIIMRHCKVSSRRRLLAFCVMTSSFVLTATRSFAQGFGDRLDGPWLDPSGLNDQPTQRFIAFTLVSLGLAVLLWVVHSAVTRKKRRRRRRPTIPNVQRSVAAPPPLPQRTHRRIPTLETDLELEIFGCEHNAGYCVRAIVVHVDNHYVVVRVNDEDLEIPCPLADGEVVTGYFWRPGDAGYVFHTDVVEIRHVGQTYLLLRPPRELERHQRTATRSCTFLRIDIVLAHSGRLGSGEAGEGLRSRGVEPRKHRGS